MEERKTETRKQARRVVFNEASLLDEEKGLRKLYHATMNFHNDESRPVNQKLSQLITMYKEWHFQMAPRFTFSYFMDRCQFFGVRQGARAYVQQMRKIYKGKATWRDQKSGDEEEPIDVPDMMDNPEPVADAENDLLAEIERNRQMALERKRQYQEAQEAALREQEERDEIERSMLEEFHH